MGNYELSNEEKRILQKRKELAQQAKERGQLFWIEDYPNFSTENKVKYWLSNIHKGMRIQGEATNNPYSEFSIEWYNFAKSKESDFDLIFSEVVSRMGINFNWNEYYKRTLSPRSPEC